jgi:hypothetical protein
MPWAMERLLLRRAQRFTMSLAMQANVHRLSMVKPSAAAFFLFYSPLTSVVPVVMQTKPKYAQDARLFAFDGHLLSPFDV